MEDSNAQERTPLLNVEQIDQRIDNPSVAQAKPWTNHEKTKAYLASFSVFLFILAIVIAGAVIGNGLPKDPMKAAISILERSPVIVGEI